MFWNLMLLDGISEDYSKVWNFSWQSNAYFNYFELFYICMFEQKIVKILIKILKYK